MFISKLGSVLRKFAKRVFGTRKNGSRWRGRRRYIRLFVEPLEEKIAPADLTWIGADGALWSIATNWAGTTNQPPAAGDTVIFNQGTGRSLVDANFQGMIETMRLEGTFSGTIELQHDLQTGALSQTSGTIDGTANLTVMSYVWSGGTLKGPGTTTVTGGSGFRNNITLDGRLMVNNGTIDLNTITPVGMAVSPSTLTMQNGGRIVNELNANFRATGDDISTITGQGDFENHGYVDVQSQLDLAVTAALWKDFNVDGTLNFQADTFFMNDVTVQGNGAVNLQMNRAVVMGDLSFNGGTVALTSNAIDVSILGDLNIQNTSTFTFNTATFVAGSLSIGPNANAVENADLTVAGSVSSKGWTLNMGNIQLQQGATFLNWSDFTFFSTSFVSGLGSFLNTGRVIIGALGGEVKISSLLSNTGALVAETGGQFVIPGNWTNLGAVELEWSTLEVDGVFVNAGIVRVKNDSGMASNATSQLEADTVINEGTFFLQQGAAPGDTSSLTIGSRPGFATGGDFTQTANGTLAMWLNSNPVPCLALDATMLSVAGTANLGGTWNVALAQNANANDGPWTPIMARAVAQTFTATNLPQDFTVQYLPQIVSVSHAPV